MHLSGVTDLVLVNLGTPESATPDAVRKFLAEFLSDPDVIDLPRWLWRPILHGMVLRNRPARVALQYQAIWTPAGSPLRVATERITARAQQHGGDRLRVHSAYRYGEPSLDSVMQRIAGTPGGPIVVTPLFPQQTDATTGTVFRRARAAALLAGVTDRLVERVIAPDDRGYIAALAARARAGLDSAIHRPEHLVVSFHGIPIRYNSREGARYTRECTATYDALIRAIEWPRDRSTLAYQSKFGPERWLTPATADALAGLPGSGVRHAAIIAPGFVTEGLETLEELAIRGRETFVEAGGTALSYLAAVEDHPAFVASLVALAGE